MEVRNGFKLTEAGIIPNDWQSVAISSASKLINGRGFKPHEWKKEGLPIIRIQNLNGSDEYNFFSGSYDKKLEVKSGQLLFAWSGSKGTSFGPHIWDGETGLLNYHTWKVEINESNIEKEYYLHALKNLTKYIENKAHGASALVHVQKWEMEKFQFPCPSTKTEQNAIANVLRDVDTLIINLGKLIEKKRVIMQGAIQQLFTPKDGWIETTLGEILDVVSDYTANGSFESLKNNVTYYSEPNYAVLVRTTDLGRTIFVPERFTDKGGYDYLAKTSLHGGEIVIANVGSLGKVFRVPKFDMPMTLAPNTYLLKFNNHINEDFIFQWLSSKEFYLKLTAKIGSTTLQAINKDSLRSIILSIPKDLSEQLRIAQILNEIDTEIEAQKQKFYKYKMLKQGMMQELLTGKTRLI